MALFSLLFSWTFQALTLLFILLFTAFLGYCLYVLHIHRKYDHIPGPPRDNFLLGHLPTIIRLTKNDGVVHDTFLKWAERYGSVYRINVFHTVAVCVYSPEATKEILMSPKYPKTKHVYKKLFNLFGQRFFGEGLITARDHEKWYKQRRMMDPAFSSVYLRGLTGTFNERAEKLMDRFADAADGNTEVNMLRLFNVVTLDVIAKIAFGVDVDLEKTSSPFPKAIDSCMEGMIYYLRDPFFQLYPKNKRFVNEVREACRLLRATGSQWINERKAAMQNGDDVPKDILTQIIKCAGKEESMTEEDEELMLDNFVTFFIAGQETTANQLAFCVMELAKHPHILEKVQREVDDVIGVKQEISYDNLGELTYLSQVLKETLRMYPTAPGTSRELEKDIVIDGIRVPGGVNCMLSTYVAGRMDKFFKDPLIFDPDRFHPDAAKPYYCYYPFALGPRSCLGQNFAQMEAKVVMAKLIQRFDFTLVPGQSLEMVDTGTLRPKSGVVCSIKHRNYKK